MVGGMGHTSSVALGYSLSNNHKTLCIDGDGSFLMNVQELETISYNKLPIKIFIINNGGYALIKGTQEGFLNKNYVGVDKSSGLGIPNFAKVAYAYSIKYEKISTNDELNTKLSNSLIQNEPIIFDVMVDPDQRVIPKLESGKVLHDMAPNLDQKIIDKIMKV